MSNEAVTLQVRLVGDVDGLSDHRLSVAHFGDSLTRLLRAYRGSASAILRGEGASETVSIHPRARALDLQIASVLGDCVDLRLQAATLTTAQPLIDESISVDFETKAAHRLLDDIEHSRGHAGEFLAKLPAGLRTHRYAITIGGVEVRAVERMGSGEHQAPVERVPPRLKVGVGVITGVFFSPLSVRIRLDVGGNLAFKATDRLVENAFALRGQTAVVIRYVDYGDERRLLTLDGQGKQPTMTADERKAHLVLRWQNVLLRLGE